MDTMQKKYRKWLIQFFCCIFVLTEYGACGWTVEPHRLDTCVAEIGHPEGHGKKRISIVCGENKP